jgi:hypothetical protein
MPIIIGMQRQHQAAATSTNTSAQARWERALIERIAQRDPTALSELYDGYAGQVYGMAIAATGDPLNPGDHIHLEHMLSELCEALPEDELHRLLQDGRAADLTQLLEELI